MWLPGFKFIFKLAIPLESVVLIYEALLIVKEISSVSMLVNFPFLVVNYFIYQGVR